jgi:hypothetical protein
MEKEKKYKLNIKIRKGMEDTPFAEFIIDTMFEHEAFQVKTLSTFKDDAHLVFFLEEIPEEEIKSEK